MSRSLPEWIGRSDDSRIPPRVRDRIFERSGKVCHWCKLPIHPTDKWQCDHVIALIDGGANAEANLAPIHTKFCHPEKTGIEVARKSKVASVRQRHNGITKSVGRIRSAGFPKFEKPECVSSKPPLPRTSLYKPIDPEVMDSLVEQEVKQQRDWRNRALGKGKYRSEWS